MNKTFLIMAIISGSMASASAQQTAKHEDTELYTPVPPVITPGKTYGNAPSDAVVLFGGKDLSQWTSVKEKGKPAMWTVGKGFFTVKKGTGNIETKKSFTNYQLHIEWQIPAKITGEGQARGNSGLFLASIGPGDDGYELQIMDTYNNKTYTNGQVGSIYKQGTPLANPARKPGEWQAYDVIWTAPVFADNGDLKTPAYVTVFMNGVLVQNHFELKGPTQYIGQPTYKGKKHGASPIKLQDHGDPSEPISYRNIWIRELK